MEISKQFENEIAPFYWVEGGTGASVCLSEVGEYLQGIFDTRADEGFIGNGYDWGSLAQVFLYEKCPKLQEKINFDPEAGMFCAYSEDKEALDMVRDIEFYGVCSPADVPAPEGG